MGKYADRLINGQDCSWCGVYLDPNERVYLVDSFMSVKMPKNGSGYGIPVICKDCAKDELKT